MIQHNSDPVKQGMFSSHRPVLKVLGLGGGGCNAVNRMIELGLDGIEFIAANTDHQALQNSLAPVKIQLGPTSTRGLGAGGNPAVGEAAAEESVQQIANALRGADMVFLTAGMGGGTGTGSIAVAARVAQAVSSVTIAIVTTPFSFEVGRRQQSARQGLAKLREHTDTLITVPNDRLLSVASRNLTLELAFRLADDVLRQGIQGIAELITETGIINVDFAHIRRLMKMGGASLMSIGYGQGENKALQAVEQALNHPLLEHTSLESAAGMIVNFTGGNDLSFFEVTDALSHLHKITNNQAEIIPGVISDPEMHDRAQVILVITGLGGTPLEKVLPGAEKYINTRPNPAPAPVSVPAQNPADLQNQYNAANVANQVVPVSQGRMEADPRVARPAASFNKFGGITTPANTEQRVASTTPVNLDIPAFIRRRADYSA